MSLIGLISLTSCSDDQEPGNRQRVTFEAQSCSQVFDEITPESAAGEMGPMRPMGPISPMGYTTRTMDTWEPPTGYTTYSGSILSLFAEQVDLFYKSIDAFFTLDGGATPLHGTFYYNSEGHWRFGTDEEIANTTYYLYGYIPKEVAESATITGNSNFSDGAVLTINGMKTVTHSDVCVIIGAKNGYDGGKTEIADNKYQVPSLVAGDFAVTTHAASSATTGTSGNEIYLLFDHIYSAVRLNFRVDEKYAALRTIELTKLELVALNSTSSTKLKAKYNATITLSKTTAGASPIVNVVFTPDNTSADVAYEPIYSGDEVPLPSDKYPVGDPKAGEYKYTSFMGCFVPGQNTHFKLRSTYNVKDKEGNLIREGCEAENDLDLRSIFKMAALTLERGHMYSISLTVKPTYLYVLSEPDLDNPTLTIGE